MSNTRCEVLPWILLPVAVAAAFSFMLPSIDLESMYLVSIVALLAHIHYGACVVSLMKYNYALVIIIYKILVYISNYIIYISLYLYIHTKQFICHVIDFVIAGASNVPSLSYSDVLHKKSFRLTTCRRYMLKTKRITR